MFLFAFGYRSTGADSLVEVILIGFLRFRKRYSCFEELIPYLGESSRFELR